VYEYGGRMAFGITYSYTYSYTLIAVADKDE